MGVIRRAVHRIEHPGAPRLPLSLDGKFFREDRVVGKPLRDERAKHALDVAIDLGDEIDRSLFLDVKIVGAGQLHGADLDDGFDRSREKNRR